MSAGIVNTPSAFVTADALTPASPSTLTLAPGMTPPPLSVTVPVIDEVVPPCANTGLTASTVSTTACNSCLHHFIVPPLLARATQSGVQGRWPYQETCTAIAGSILATFCNARTDSSGFPPVFGPRRMCSRRERSRNPAGWIPETSDLENARPRGPSPASRNRRNENGGQEVVRLVRFV